MARHFPEDHPQRLVLANEVHARPPLPTGSPSRGTCLAVLSDPQARDDELRHLESLAAKHGLAGPQPSASHFHLRLGDTSLTWERHGEFSTYLVAADGPSPTGSTPQAAQATDSLPSSWLKAIPGQTMAIVHVEVSRAESVGLEGEDSLQDLDARSATRHEALRTRFGHHPVVGSRVGGGLASVYTDFRIDADGCTRFWLVNRGFSDAQTGRFVQRLVELEVYRVLALLALPIARRHGPRIAAIETSLARLTDAMARPDGDDEKLLQELTQLAAEVESGIAASQFRFGACEAYDGLVRRRIAELGETRIPGLQTLDEFMGRRLAPAVATCANVSQRLRQLAERIGQTSNLLATRVGIERGHQNQALLASMDRRAKLQLRLQQTVEGLSVAAITYYVVGLLGYVAKGVQSAGWLNVSSDVVTAIAVPVVACTALLLLRLMRKRVTRESTAESSAGLEHTQPRL
jgi:uncharacterized membrane-anchored protein